MSRLGRGDAARQTERGCGEPQPLFSWVKGGRAARIIIADFPGGGLAVAVRRRHTGKMKTREDIFSDAKYDAVLFDLDGVLTATASLHAAAWKRMFDTFLSDYGARHGRVADPFDIGTDYRLHVDGKLRYDGVRTFLGSRGIVLPEGEPSDPPEAETVCGLGNRKNRMVHLLLREQGVERYESSVRMVELLRSRGIRTAVVSASRNCSAVLKGAGIAHLFDAQVDGTLAAELSLPGKPSPATFLKAAELLGVEPRRAVVVEDAVSGVQAGRAGGFGLVIGVARHGDEEILRRAGADLVVHDLGALLP